MIKPDENAIIHIDVAGHSLSVIVEGAARFASLLSYIAEAKESLRLFYYIFADDSHGLMVREALIDACNRGVSVTILIDGFGSSPISDAFFEPLIDAGGRFDRFLPRYGRRYLLRNHQKLLVADGRHAVIGGANIAADYFSEMETGGQWHDLSLAITGPCVGRLAAWFDALIHWMTSEKPGIRSLQKLITQHSDTSGPIRWVIGGPFRRLSPFAKALRNDLDAARVVDMIQAYFVPNWTFLRRLGRAAKRGTVRIITAAFSDNSTTIGAARHCYALLLRRNAKIFEYQGSKLHMKVIIADDVVYLGSANYDTRSLYINVELMLRIASQDFADAMRDFCAGELVKSHVVDTKWLQRTSGPLRKIRWFVAYFLFSTLDYTVSRSFNIGADQSRPS